MKTPFHSSNYGDRSLFFEHFRFETDLALRPEWESKAAEIIAAEGSVNNYTHADLPW